MIFDVKQRKVINASENNILCLASAGSGKTTVVTERVRRLIDEGCDPSKIACITFTNMAAEEMKQRLGSKAEKTYIGTIHGLANRICLQNGIDTSDLIDVKNFDGLLRKALTIPKQKYPQLEHLLIDEFQDTGALEYQFIEKIPTKNFMAIGDERQSIYGFKNASDEYLRHLYADVNCTKYYLNNNYRCTSDIIKYADELIWGMEKLSPKAVAVKDYRGEIIECGFGEAVDELQWSKNWGSWFVICRTNYEVETAMSILSELDIPIVSFKKGDLDLAEMNSLISENKVKVLTIHSAKGLQAKNVIVVGARMYNEEERKIAYVAATRSENTLYWCPSIAAKKRGYKEIGLKGIHARAGVKMVEFK